MKPYYSHAGITIYHGDCRDVAQDIVVDCLVTDPPYGLGGISHRPESQWYGYDIPGNQDSRLRDWAMGWSRGETPAIVFDACSASVPVGVRATLVWDKGPSTGFNGDNTLPWKSTYELIRIFGSPFVGGRIFESVLSFHQRGFARPDHPHEKPVELMEHLVARTTGTVYDPFMGSGTTLVAAKNLGRKAIGIEIEERYCEIAAKRLAQEVLPL